MDQSNNSEKSTFSETYKIFLQTLEVVLEQFIKSRDTIIKNLLNLSAGSLVATITLLQVFGKEFSNGLFLLPLSWFLFGCTIVACFIHIGSSQNYWFLLESFRWYESTAKEAVSEIEIDATEWQKVKVAISVLQEKLEDDSRYTSLRNSIATALFTFIGGLACLGIFATLNLPW